MCLGQMRLDAHINENYQVESGRALSVLFDTIKWKCLFVSHALYVRRIIYVCVCVKWKPVKIPINNYW